MASNLPSNVAVWAAVCAVAFTAVLFLYALGLRTSHVLHARRTHRLHSLWWPIFAEAITANKCTGIHKLKIASPGSKLEVLREWSRFRSLVRGSSTASLDALAEQLELQSVARKRLKRSAISSKLLAVQALGQLKDQSSWSAIEDLLEHPNIAISVCAATALVNIDGKRAVPRIISLIGIRSRWPRTQVGRLLNLAGSEVVSPCLCGAIEGAPTDQAIRLLQFSESAFTADVNNLVERILNVRTEPGLLSAALKAVRGQVRTKTIASLAQHDVWYVRMQAASLLGRFGQRENYQILEPLLSDTHWWVRYRAAQAIVGFPFLGPNALRKLRDRQRDQFARDILNHVLAEKGLA